MFGQSLNSACFGIKITTVDPTQSLVKGVMKGDAQERTVAVYTVPNVFRWPQVDENWMVEQKNGTWYLSEAFPTTDTLTTIQAANPGDVVMTSPTGTMHVIGSPDGSTDFTLNAQSFWVPGDLIPSAALTRPGALLCDGSSYSTTAYPTLFTAIQYTYGGSGNNFNVPDLRGRAPIGAGAGGSLTARSLGQTGGEEKHTISASEMPAHNHTVTDFGHSHGMGGYVPTLGSAWSYPGMAGGIFANTPSGLGSSTNATQFSTSGISVGSAGGGSSHNNMQPFAVVNWFVKY